MPALGTGIVAAAAAGTRGGVAAAVGLRGLLDARLAAEEAPVHRAGSRLEHRPENSYLYWYTEDKIELVFEDN